MLLSIGSLNPDRKLWKGSSRDKARLIVSSCESTKDANATHFPPLLEYSVMNCETCRIRCSAAGSCPMQFGRWKSKQFISWRTEPCVVFGWMEANMLLFRMHPSSALKVS